MTLLRVTLTLGLCVAAFASAGLLAAVALHALAPGYYPGVFPEHWMNGNAYGVGQLTGIGQGGALGLAVGLGLLVCDMLTGERGWRGSARRALLVAALALAGGVAVGLVGWAVGTRSPEAYRDLRVPYERMTNGRKAAFSAADVGLGLGASQGLLAGAGGGLAAAVGLAWRRSRRAAGSPGAADPT